MFVTLTGKFIMASENVSYIEVDGGNEYFTSVKQFFFKLKPRPKEKKKKIEADEK